MNRKQGLRKGTGVVVWDGKAVANRFGSVTVIHRDSFYLFPLRYWGVAALLSLSIGRMAESTVLIRLGRMLHAGRNMPRMVGISTKGKKRNSQRNPQRDGVEIEQGDSKTDIKEGGKME